MILNPEYQAKNRIVLFVQKNKWLIGTILVSVFFRIAASIFFGDQVTDLPGTFDQISYHSLALRVLGGHGFSFGETWWPITQANAPTAHWSFLYTLYLVFVYAVTGSHPLAARLLQAILTGVLQPYLTYKIGSRIFNKFIGLISAMLTCIYAYFIYYDATLMTEPFFITAILAVVYTTILIGDRGNDTKVKKIIGLYIILGIISAVAILLRQLFLLIIPLTYIWIIWIERKRGKFSSYKYLGISTLTIVLLILPFSIYNYSRFGHFVLLNTNTGYAFFWANHPIYGTKFLPLLPPSMGTYQDLIPNELKGLDEAALDQALLKLGIKFVLDDPGRYILLSVSRIPIYFMFWPSSGSGLISNISRVVSFGLMLPFMIYGLIVSFRRIKQKKYSEITLPAVILLCAICGFYTIIHLLSWSLVRYRLPVDALFLIFAGVAVADIIGQFQKSLGNRFKFLNNLSV